MASGPANLSSLSSDDLVNLDASKLTDAQLATINWVQLQPSEQQITTGRYFLKNLSGTQFQKLRNNIIMHTLFQFFDKLTDDQIASLTPGQLCIIGYYFALIPTSNNNLISKLTPGQIALIPMPYSALLSTLEYTPKLTPDQSAAFKPITPELKLVYDKRKDLIKPMNKVADDITISAETAKAALSADELQRVIYIVQLVIPYGPNSEEFYSFSNSEEFGKDIRISPLYLSLFSPEQIAAIPQSIIDRLSQLQKDALERPSFIIIWLRKLLIWFKKLFGISSFTGFSNIYYLLILLIPLIIIAKKKPGSFFRKKNNRYY